MNRRTMAGRTLLAGILVGVAALLGVLLGNRLFSDLSADASLSNDGYYLLGSLVSVLVSFCMPLSASLIAASLVMRHRDTASGAEPGDGSPTRSTD